MVEILRNKRKALLRDDEVILLLVLARRPMRARDLREGSRLPERTFWRGFEAMQRQGWAEVVAAGRGVKGEGRGKCSVCRLTLKGEAEVRRLFGGVGPTLGWGMSGGCYLE